MNDLQKKLLIIGLTAFIVWLFIGYQNHTLNLQSYIYRNSGFVTIDNYGTARIIRDFTSDTWLLTTLFITWLGSFIAFNVYKD